MFCRSLILLLLIFICAGLSPAQFEGTIDMKVALNDAGTSQVMYYTMSIKKNLMSTTVRSGGESAGKGKFIFRGDRDVLWIVSDEDKSYTELSMKDTRVRNKPGTAGKRDGSKSKIKKTGKTELILGYPCEEIVIEEGKNVTRLWGTSKLGNIYGDMMKSFGDIGGGAGSEGKHEWEEELALLKLFPLKIISMESGKITQTQEVTGINPKTIPASMFELSKDYKEQTIDPEMGKMLQDRKNGFKEKDKNDPGTNPDMEKMMEQMQNADTSGGG